MHHNNLEKLLVNTQPDELWQLHKHRHPDVSVRRVDIILPILETVSEVVRNSLRCLINTRNPHLTLVWGDIPVNIQCNIEGSSQDLMIAAGARLLLPR